MIYENGEKLPRAKNIGNGNAHNRYELNDYYDDLESSASTFIFELVSNNRINLEFLLDENDIRSIVETTSHIMERNNLFRLRKHLSILHRMCLNNDKISLKLCQ